MFVNWIYNVESRTSLTSFLRVSKNNYISASIGQMVDEKYVIHHIEVVMLERDLAVHCRIKI